MLNELIDNIRQSVNWTRMDNDPMFGGNESHYQGVGESALKVILASHLLANRPLPTSILDFACGTGRVTRWLAPAFPDADLHVADVNADWVQWTAAAFGATGWISGPEIATIQAPRQYDLIWCGSLLTHFTEHDGRLMLAKFNDWLAPSGIAVATFHGGRFLRNLINNTLPYFPEDEVEENKARILLELTSKGYGFANHRGQTNGISTNTMRWMENEVRQLNGRVITLTDDGWDDHQDVVAFQKLS